MKERTLEELERHLKDMNISPEKEIPPMIRQRQDETYAMLDSLKLRKPLHRHRILKRTAVGFAAALMLGIMVLGSGFTSPVMAKTLEQIPLVNSIFEKAGDMGLKKASEKGLTTVISSSDEHQKVKISATEVIYDGTRLSIALKREGGDFSGSFQGLRKNADGTTKMDTDGKTLFNQANDTGEIHDVEVFINDKPLNPDEDEVDSFKRSVGYILMSGSDEESLIMVLAENSYVDGGLTLPDKFQLTIKSKLTGLPNEEFSIDIPVQKDTSHNIVLFPEVSKSFNKVTTTVEKITLTPATTQLRMNDQGIEGLPSEYVDDRGNLVLNHEVYDDKGNLLQKLNGGSGWTESKKEDSDVSYSSVSDVNIEPLPEDVNYITVRTFLYKYTGTGRERMNVLNAEGYPVVEYIPELEMTVPIR